MFDRFPFLLGDEVRVGLHAPRALRGASELMVRMRCVQERYEERRYTGSQRVREEVVCYELYADSYAVKESDLASASDLSGVHLEFLLPEGDLSSRLRERPARYWELRVRASGPDRKNRYDGSFLLPVYSPNGW
jgi:hypothetical protein